MKEFLNNLIQRKTAEMEDLKKRSDESQDINEVRAIGETLAALKAEIEEAEAQLAQLDAEEEKPVVEEQANAEQTETEERSVIPVNAELRNAQVVSTFNLGGNNTMENQNMEYRNAFMEYVLRGTAIPMELRDTTTTTDAAGVIPTHLVNQIIEKMDNVGMILPLITKTAYKAGVEIPVSSVKPVASWVAEAAGSDRQKKAVTKITFNYFKLRCEIAMSMEVGTMALSAFEAKFVENVAKAMIYAIENAVINGSGSGQPKGILTETPEAGQAVTGAATYAKVCEVEGAVPEQYETGAKWCMNKKTFLQFVAMVDQAGQPIARVNYGVAGKPERTLLGRDVVISPYVADNKAFVFDFADYVLNTVYDMGITKKQDWDTEDLLTKAVMSVDGKAADKGSLVTFDITPTV